SSCDLEAVEGRDVQIRGGQRNTNLCENIIRIAPTAGRVSGIESRGFAGLGQAVEICHQGFGPESASDRETEFARRQIEGFAPDETVGTPLLRPAALKECCPEG